MDLSQFRECEKKQTGGTPIYVGDGIFYGRRLGSKKANKVVRNIKIELYGVLHESTQEDADVIYAHLLAEYGIAGWENIQDENGNELPYSESNARKVFLNPEYHLSLNRILVEKLLEFDNFLWETAEEDLEALKKP